MTPDFLASDTYQWLILPLMIFCARVTDVTLGTMRIVFTSRGRRQIAPIFGFFEVFIWIVVISQVVQNLHNIVAYVAYAAGFATGTFVGLLVEDKLAIGTLIVRAIVAKDADVLASRLQRAGFGVTRVDARGAAGAVTLIYTIVKRKDVHEALDIIHAAHPKVFLSIEEVRSTEEGIFPTHPSRYLSPRYRRKSK